MNRPSVWLLCRNTGTESRDQLEEDLSAAMETNKLLEGRLSDHSLIQIISHTLPSK